jgi:signal transduction histidine kinase
MTPPLPLRYLVASVLLFALLVGLLGFTSARRTRGELTHQLEERGLALTGAVEVASQHAIRANALLEEMIARRLLDNARLVDQLLLARPLDREALARLAEANHLRRVDLLDRAGQPYVAPPPAAPGPLAGPMAPPGMMAGRGHGMMRRGMMGEALAAPDQSHPPGRLPPHPLPPEVAARRHAMMLYMWGQRWGRLPEGAAEPGSVPPPVQDRRFWEGTVFGVAVGARSFPGLIAVHADAAFVLDFRREIGVERQLEELSRQSGVEAVGLLLPDLSVAAHSDPRRVGTRVDDGVLRQALAERRGLTRLVPRPGGGEALEVVRPLTLDGTRLGLLTLDLSTVPIREAWRRDVRAALLVGASILLLGGIGLAGIFHLQGRHLREVRALEVEVERRERLAALGNLAAVVSHEVRNPLNAVSVGLQRLAGEFRPAAGDGDDYARVVDLMQGEVRRLDGIVEDVLALARPRPVEIAATRPGALLDEVAALGRAEAAARGIDLRLRVPPELPPVRWDADQIKQVLLNLVRNGCEAMPRGGALTIAARAEAAGLVVSVEDTGEGIPAEALPRIFEPYVTTKSRGLGLGLAIARRIVELHGGRITVESRPGHGTRFTLALPLAAPALPAGGAPRA